MQHGSAAAYRYGVVLALALVAVVFFIVAPDRPASRAIGVLLTGLLLVVVLVTGRGVPQHRRRAAPAAALASIAVAALVGGDAVGSWLGSALGALLIGGTLLLLLEGLAHLVDSRGVTLQAVAGALAVYLLVGLLFALVIGVAARVLDATYFREGGDGTQSEHVYFSFTTLTTTGYGDLTPATAVGRSLAVVEMLLGQIYLVTVIGLLVGNLRRRGRAAGDDPSL